MKYICPICGYDKLNKPPYDEEGNESYEVCLCCGFEFGVDDIHKVQSSEIVFKSYRIKWINEGARWFHKPDYPGDFDLEEQLKNIENIQPMYVSIYDRRKQQE